MVKCKISDVIAKRPVVGEWVQGSAPMQYADGTFARHPINQVTGLVAEVRENGCLVRHNLTNFDDMLFMPWCCITSRTVSPIQKVA